MDEPRTPPVSGKKDGEGDVELDLESLGLDDREIPPEKLTKLGLYVDVDNGENTLPKKIRNGEIAQYNFILGMFHYFRPLMHSV